LAKIYLPARMLFLILAAITLTFGIVSSASAGVTPETHDFGVLNPGDTSSEITKTVDVPAISPLLDFVMLVDLSGSYRNDLPNIKSVAPGLWDTLKGPPADPRDLQTGLTSFIDFPQSPWGGLSDYPFRLHQDLTSDKSSWTTAINAMSASGGRDTPESQYEALLQTANQISWRATSTRVIAITTDAAFHNDTDSGGTYPGPSQAATITALNAQGIKVIAIKAPGATSQMDAIASATGGAVVSSTSTSSDIASAILTGLAALEDTVTGSLISCDPAASPVLNLTPGSVLNVEAGGSATFAESITVPVGTAPGTYECDVEFTWGETGVGIQTISFEVPIPNTPPQITVSPSVTLEATSAAGAEYLWSATAWDLEQGDLTGSVICDYASTTFPLGAPTVVKCSVIDAGGLSDADEFTVTVVDTTDPLATCDETANPSGKNVPKAGKNAGKSGQNPDGFYVLGGSDSASGVASIVVVDDVSGTVFGPWPVGTTIKLTQAEGATPDAKPGSGDIDWKVKTNGDATVVVTDQAGNSSGAACLVPKPAK